MEKSLKTIDSDAHTTGGLFSALAIKLASVIVYLIQDIKWITPNLITTASQIVNAMAIVALIVFRQPVAFILLLYFAFVLDNADGKLARFRKRLTKFGHLYDSTMDRLKTFIVDAAFITYYFDVFGNQKWLLFAAFCQFGFHAIYYNVRHIEGIKHKANVVKIHKVRSKYFDFSEGNKIIITYSLCLVNIYFFAFYFIFYGAGYVFGIAKNLYAMYRIENSK